MNQNNITTSHSAADKTTIDAHKHWESGNSESISIKAESWPSSPGFTLTVMKVSLKWSLIPAVNTSALHILPNKAWSRGVRGGGQVRPGCPPLSLGLGVYLEPLTNNEGQDVMHELDLIWAGIVLHREASLYLLRVYLQRRGLRASTPLSFYYCKQTYGVALK